MRTLLCAAFLMTSCNVVRMERNRLLDDLSQWGLHEQNVTLGDDTVRFWTSSGSRPLLLLHGFGASAIWQFHGQRYLVGEGHRVLFPDLLWFGGSSSTKRDFSLEHQVDMVEALLDRVGWQRTDVLGISYGGLVAYELAKRSPHRVRRLVIVDSPGPVYTVADRQALLERLATEDLANVLVPSEPEQVDRLMQIAYYDPPWTPGFADRQVLEELYSENREEKAELLHTVMARAGEEPVPVSLPALVVWGREDQVFPLEIGERLADFLGAQLFVIDEARHAPNLEHHKLFNEKVTEFLR